MRLKIFLGLFTIPDNAMLALEKPKQFSHNNGNTGVILATAASHRFHTCFVQLCRGDAFFHQFLQSLFWFTWHLAFIWNCQKMQCAWCRDPIQIRGLESTSFFCYFSTQSNPWSNRPCNTSCILWCRQISSQTSYRPSLTVWGSHQERSQSITMIIISIINCQVQRDQRANLKQCRGAS